MASVASGSGATFVRCLAGKLIGVRTGDLRTRPDWEALIGTFFRAIADFAGRPVICADMRELTALDPDAQLLVVDGMRQFNEKLMRAALIVSPVSPAGLRLERVLQEANSSARRVCADPVLARAWLSSCLDANERLALEEFLASRGMGRRSRMAVPSARRKPG